jgi:hypothetical protein
LRVGPGNQWVFAGGGGAYDAAIILYPDSTDSIGDLYATIFGNIIADDGSSTLERGISFDTGGGGTFSSVHIRDNEFINITDPIKTSGAGVPTTVQGNIGYVTKNSGSSSITSGSTSVAVAHGLSVTPVAEDFNIIGKENPTNDVGTIWISGIGSANFTVNVENDPGASDWDFGWSVDTEH